MGYKDTVEIKPKSRVDQAYKVYIPKSVRETFDIKPKDKLEVLVDEEGKSIKLIK